MNKPGSINLLRISFIAVLSHLFVVSCLSQKTVDYFGYYFIQKPSRSFANIEELHLAGSYGAAQKPPFHGLTTKKEGDERFPSIEPHSQRSESDV